MWLRLKLILFRYFMIEMLIHLKMASISQISKVGQKYVIRDFPKHILSWILIYGTKFPCNTQ